jgi:protein-disulfide isomerase
MRAQTAAIAAPSRIPAGTNATGDAIVVGTGPVTVDAYIDFQCPFCRQFEETQGPALELMIEQRLISMAYHPLGFLDRLSTTRYSSRASSASACASDAGAFPEYKDALFADQPPEGGPGLSDEELVELGHVVGITDPAFDEGVRNHVYLEWTEYVTALAVARGVSGTPSTFVEGVPVPASARAIAAAVAAATG